MGCGGSVPKPAPNPSLRDDSGDVALRGIVVWGAQGLKDADVIGISDPYCVARVGPKGSAWDQKLRGAGRRSAPVSDSSSPQWNMSFTVDVRGMIDPEVQVRVYDKDWLVEDDFLGQVAVPLEHLKERKDCALSMADGSAAKGSVALQSMDTLGLHSKLGPKPSGFFEEMGPIGTVKSVDVEGITGAGPLRCGTGPGLPVSLQGIFWLTLQGPSSALATFGGPSGDGGGCSPGQMLGKTYKVRVGGDRVWAFAEEGRNLDSAMKRVQAIDLVYHFNFDDALNPTRCQIYPEGRNLGFTLTAEWLLDFEMELVKKGDERFPGSVVWTRSSSVLGTEVKSKEYALVQVIDGNQQRIEPAWAKFVEYQKSSEAGNSPGKIFYHEAA